MIIPAARIPGLSALSRDYYQDFARTADFFNGAYADPAAYARQVAHVKTRVLRRDLLCSVLRAQNLRFGCGAETLAQIDKLERADGGAIVTGQQAGLFGGPLYTVYKALTTVKLAATLEAGGTAATPVFWLAADDHDTAEIDHISFLDQENRLRLLRCPLPPGTAKLPVAHIAVPDAISTVLAELESGCRASEFKPGVLAALAADYAPGRSMVEACARWLTRLFKPLGLVMVDPSDPRLRALGTDLFVREIAADSPSTSRAMEATRRLQEQGYSGQVQVHAGTLNLFYCDPARHSIQAAAGGFLIKDLQRTLSKTELLDLARTQPGSFSPNVLLRPLLQDVLLPTVAYVAGPGEIAYYAQMKDIYAEFGLVMPVIRPRASLTIVEGPIARVLEKHNLQVPDLWTDQAALLARVSPPPAALQERIAMLRSHLHADLEALATTGVTLDPGLAATVAQTRERIEQQVQYLEKKIGQSTRQSDESGARQVRKASAALFPGGTLQERSLNIVPFLFMHGFGFMERLFAAIDGAEIDHQVFYV